VTLLRDQKKSSGASRTPLVTKRREWEDPGIWEDPGMFGRFVPMGAFAQKLSIMPISDKQLVMNGQ
jgi:hypothetical protein